MFYWRKYEIFEDSEFSILTLIQKSKALKTMKLFEDLSLVCWKKLQVSEIFKFSILGLMQKSETWKTRKLFQDL